METHAPKEEIANDHPTPSTAKALLLPNPTQISIPAGRAELSPTSVPLSTLIATTEIMFYCPPLNAMSVKKDVDSHCGISSPSQHIYIVTATHKTNEVKQFRFQKAEAKLASLQPLPKGLLVSFLFL